MSENKKTVNIMTFPCKEMYNGSFVLTKDGQIKYADSTLFWSQKREILSCRGAVKLWNSHDSLSCLVLFKDGTYAAYEDDELDAFVKKIDHKKIKDVKRSNGKVLFLMSDKTVIPFGFSPAKQKIIKTFL